MSLPTELQQTRKKASRPWVMNNLLLLQGVEAFWVSRSASVPDHDVWCGQPTENVKKVFSPLYTLDLDPLNAAANLCERTPRGRFKSRDSLTVLLGYPYVQHLVLPWQSGLHQPEDWQRYAQTQFEQQYGKDHQWQIVIDPAAAGQPRLAAGTNTALFKGLQLLAKMHKLRLVSCMSLMASAAQQHWKVLPDDCVLSLPQQGGLECLFRQKGVWHGVSGMPTLPETALSANVASMAALMNITYADAVIPTIVVTPSPGRVNQTHSYTWPARWVGAAHPWLDGSESWGCPTSFTSLTADAYPATRIEPTMAVGGNEAVASINVPDGGVDISDKRGHVLPPGKSFIKSATTKGLDYRWMYWRQTELLEEAVPYGEWKNETWRQTIGYSDYPVIYCWLGAPLSWWMQA